MRSTKRLWDLAGVFVLLVLPLILFWPVTVGSKTLLPADNLYQWQPYRAFADQQGVLVPPHNELLSDLVLENLAWKQFIVGSLKTGQLPLWNPNLFAGVPFLAAGQHSALYPLSALFYTLPLTRAYGVFTVVQLWLAGAFMYLFVRVLRLGPFPALIAGITYQLSAFFLVSVVFTMVIAAAAWLPLLLAVVEIVIRKQEGKGTGPFVPIVYVVVGALGLGMVVLAGHPEILVYTLVVTAYYAAVRLVLLWRRIGSWRPALRVGAWLAFMAGLGLGLGSIQLIPLLELVTRSFREGSVSYRDVVGWAYPARQIATFLVPDLYGNPAAHGYWDLVTRQWVAANRIFWGIKNYVEGGSYVGILPLVLAAVAVAGTRRRSANRRIVWIFAALAALSLFFVFGTPLYAVLYYGLPGVKQLHSPFRWVFPYTLSIAVLAGYGIQQVAGCRAQVAGRKSQDTDAQAPIPNAQYPISRLLPWGLFVVGLVLVAGLAIVGITPKPFVPLADRFLAAVPKAQEAFDSGQMLMSYEWPKFMLFGLLLLASGLLLILRRQGKALGADSGGATQVSQERDHGPAGTGAARGGNRLLRALRSLRMTGWYRRMSLWKGAAVVVVAVDLLVFGSGFNPSGDPKWLDFRPPAVEFLEHKAAEGDPWRLTTYQVPGDTKTLNANIPWLHGLQDVRGYDSIIPRQYVEYMTGIEPQGELPFNRIAPIYDARDLSSPLLDLLTVRYVVTEGEIPNADYRLVYDAEVRIYENTGALPRAFALPAAEAVSPVDLPARLRTLDPRQVVLLEEKPGLSVETRFLNADWPLQPASIVRYTPNEVTIDVTMPGAGWLVLADSYFPGWKAYRSDASDQPRASNPEPPADESEMSIARADGNFRAVWLDSGSHRVRFKYTPLSFKIGLYGSFLATVVLVLLVGYWLWGRLYRESADDPAVKRVAKNSLVPMGLQLLNRTLDFAFAMLTLRILAPEMAGRYTFAVAFIGYFDILVRFGLGTLLTREVARDRAHGDRYLSTTTVLRGLLWLTSLPLIALAMLVYLLAGQMSPDIALAIGLFALGLLFSSLADGLSAVFNAYEKMEYPAAIATATAIIRVSLGVLALLAGWGFVGLAGVSVVTNVVSAAILAWLMVRHCFRPKLRFDAQLGRWMMATSFPLMINAFLATAFFRIDVLLLKPMKGDAVVGYYGAAYKYIDGLNIIPAYFTAAVFPLMSRYAASARDSLLRAYVLSLRLLIMIALPVAVGTFVIAEGLILLLGGAQYLPDSRIALQLIIWFLPLSFVNSVTQYVLIAIDQQRFLTKAFLIGVAFNVVANLLVIPAFSYKGSAVVTVLSEFALLLPFYYAVRKHLGPLPWGSLFWRPALASAAMGAVLWLLRGLAWPLLIPIGGGVYLAALLAIGGFRQPDMDLLLKRLLPVERLRAWLGGRGEAQAGH